MDFPPVNGRFGIIATSTSAITHSSCAANHTGEHNGNHNSKAALLARAAATVTTTLDAGAAPSMAPSGGVPRRNSHS